MKPEIQNELDEVVDRILFYLEDHILNTIDWQMDGNIIIDDKVLFKSDEWMERRRYVYNKVIKLL